MPNEIVYGKLRGFYNWQLWDQTTKWTGKNIEIFFSLHDSWTIVYDQYVYENSLIDWEQIRYRVLITFSNVDKKLF